MTLAAALLVLSWVTPSLSHLGPSARRLGQSDRSGAAYDPNVYAASLDTEVTYDNLLAQGYDDGYGPRAFSQFEEALAPYGAWIDAPPLGRVWAPSAAIVGPAFCPYATNGNWVLTDFGWTWESGWAWGWAPFHYGRWAMLEDRGWVWVPGTIWGPAWVAWRAGRKYVGWAPLPPRGMHLGRPIGPRSPWRFVPVDGLGATTLAYVPLRKVPAIFGSTAAVSNVKEIRVGTLGARVNVGPIGKSCWGAEPCVPPPLATAAPNALPRLNIKPRSGAPLDSRPWVAAGALEQTPVSRWPAPSGS
jgi:hypothetical protein